MGAGSHRESSAPETGVLNAVRLVVVVVVVVVVVAVEPRLRVHGRKALTHQILRVNGPSTSPTAPVHTSTSSTSPDTDSGRAAHLVLTAGRGREAHGVGARGSLVSAHVAAARRSYTGGRRWGGGWRWRQTH